ncbi:MAG: preQ(1) synthase [Kiritimatiellae bacterium]|nr:preQ(1) synthase [Kiritimatiellia bacterium]
MNKQRDVKRRTGLADGITILRRSIQRYPGNPAEAKLEVFPNPRPDRDYWIHFECPEFTSLCPITGQPDFALITIDYIPAKLCLESKSLKLYLFSYRNTGVFHEDATNRILDDIVKTCRPRRLTVNGRFNSRGGIAITVRVEHPSLIAKRKA